MRVSAIAALFLATTAPFQGAFAHAQAGVKAVSFNFANWRRFSNNKYALSCYCFDIVGGT
jgi:hypothetical protein